jgi:hypothetical protein
VKQYSGEPKAQKCCEVLSWHPVLHVYRIAMKRTNDHYFIDPDVNEGNFTKKTVNRLAKKVIPLLKYSTKQLYPEISKVLGQR